MWRAPVLRRRVLSVPGLRRPVALVHLSDLHFGAVTARAIHAHAAALVEAEQPELVVLTGDFVGRSRRHLGAVRDALAALPGRRLAVLGNHDHFVGGDLVARALEEAGVEVLANRWITHGELVIVGLDDRLTGHARPDDAVRALPCDRPALGLVHDPAAAELLWARGVRVVLAGHTHGGQVHLPPVTTGWHAVLGQPWLAGWCETERGGVYVNAGVGAGAFPWRIGGPAHREVAALRLVPAG